MVKKLFLLWIDCWLFSENFFLFFLPCSFLSLIVEKIYILDIVIFCNWAIDCSSKFFHVSFPSILISFFSTCPRSMLFPSDKDDGWLTLSYFCLYRPFCRLLLFSVLASGSRAEIAFTPPRKPVFVMLEFPAR